MAGKTLSSSAKLVSTRIRASAFSSLMSTPKVGSVNQAANAHEALQVIHERCPTLVLMDVNSVLGGIQKLLEKIKVPVLIVAHEDDSCWVTPPEGAEDIKKMLSNASRVGVKYFTGGKESLTNPCRAKSAHGFYGIEEEVVRYIANFVKNN